MPYYLVLVEAADKRLGRRIDGRLLGVLTYRAAFPLRALLMRRELQVKKPELQVAPRFVPNGRLTEC